MATDESTSADPAGGEDNTRPGMRRVRVRVRRTEDGWFAGLAGGQLSSQLRALADANGLLAVPRSMPAGRAGEAYDTILIGEPD